VFYQNSQATHVITGDFVDSHYQKLLILTNIC